MWNGNRTGRREQNYRIFIGKNKQLCMIDCNLPDGRQYNVNMGARPSVTTRRRHRPPTTCVNQLNRSLQLQHNINKGRTHQTAYLPGDTMISTNAFFINDGAPCIAAVGREGVDCNVLRRVYRKHTPIPHHPGLPLN